ncbi:RDD family protein, partial [Sedimenticola sp.]|uniref:RDD family protein n=1 Tax=Sedimenticola sp. TaxID=1940285 RepID=UPI003D09B774
FESSNLQGTPGKWLLGIKVMSVHGRRIGVARAYWRQTLYLVSLMLFFISVWYTVAHNDRTGAHDLYSKSRVVKRATPWWEFLAGFIRKATGVGA